MKKVLLVPGIFMISLFFDKIKAELEKLGYEIEIFIYPFFPNKQNLIDDFIEKVYAFKPEIIIGHSLGGNIVAKQIQNLHESVTTVICLGSPLKGSSLAKNMSTNFFSGLIAEAIYSMLLNEIVIPESNVNVGVIAGKNNYFGFDLLFQMHTEDNDGTISIEETKVKGVKHLVMPVGHTEFLFSENVIKQIDYFIQNKDFER